MISLRSSLRLLGHLEADHSFEFSICRCSARGFEATETATFQELLDEPLRISLSDTDTIGQQLSSYRRWSGWPSLLSTSRWRSSPDVGHFEKGR